MTNNKFNLTEKQLQFWLGRALNKGIELDSDAVMIWAELLGEIDLVHFQNAFQALIDRTDVLRTTFHEVELSPFLQVAEKLNHKIDIVDFRAETAPDEKYQTWLAERSRKVLDLEKSTFDCALIQISKEKCIWYFKYHHMIGDFITSVIFFQNISEFYKLSLQGKLDQAPAIPQFSKYIDYEPSRKASAEYQRSVTYWKSKINPETGKKGILHETTMYSIDFGLERTQKMLSLSKSEGLGSPALIFLPVLFEFMAHFEKQEVLRVGMNYKDRPAEFQLTPGLFVATCPLQTKLNEDETFLSLAKKLRAEIKSDMEQSQYSVPNPLNNRIWDVLFNYMNNQNLFFAGLPTRWYRVLANHS